MVLNDLTILVLMLQYFFVEISVMFWFCHICDKPLLHVCVAKMVVLIPKCTSTPGGMDSAPDQESLIYHLS